MIEFRTKRKFDNWTLSDWPGNSDLGLKACIKTFKHHNRNIPIWIFGDDKYQFSFCVANGADSDYSYTGLCVDCYTITDAQKYIDQQYIDKKLIR